MSDDPDPSSSGDTQRISTAITVLNPDWRRILPEAESLARTAATATLSVATPLGGPVNGQMADRAAEISLVLADDATLQRYNLRYRGIDKPTNVLSFATGEEPSPDDAGPLLLGDVLLARETLEREAEQQGKRFADHFCHMVVHGVLHLLGHDHETEAKAAAMERLERDALDRLGVADPYVLAVPS